MKLAALLFSLAATTLHAQVVVKDAWVRATVPGAAVAGAYVTLQSTSPVTLVRASSPRAGMVEIHDMKMVDGVMEMKALPNGIAIAPGKPVELKPGGRHLMLMKLTSQVKAGERVPLTLVFEDARKKPLTVNVDAVARESKP